MIVKEFRKRGTGFAGQDRMSWVDNWRDVVGFISSARNADKDHLSPFFKRYFRFPPHKILEGGCGTGKYVIAYRKLGYDIIGVDFAGETIKRIRHEMGGDFPVYEADITSLPFDNNYFDCYYSGGVIEHFEEGPDKPLMEAHRVLKKGGLLLVTVPYINILRRIIFSFRMQCEMGDLIQKKVYACRVDSGVPRGYDFCEYIFDSQSLRSYFEKNNFVIEKIYPTDFLWGEIGFLFRNKIRRGNNCKKNIGHKEKSGHNNIDSRVRMRHRSLLQDLTYEFLVTENIENKFFKPLILLLNYLSGHMVLFIARAV